VSGLQLDSIILKVFSNLNDPTILRFVLLIPCLIGIFLVCLVAKSCYNDCILAARVAWEEKVMEWEDLEG